MTTPAATRTIVPVEELPDDGVDGDVAPVTSEAATPTKKPGRSNETPRVVWVLPTACVGSCCHVWPSGEKAMAVPSAGSTSTTLPGAARDATGVVPGDNVRSNR